MGAEVDIARVHELLRGRTVPSRAEDDAEFSYDLNEAQEVLLGAQDEHLLLVGSIRTRKRELLERLLENIDGHGVLREDVIFLDYTLPLLHGADVRDYLRTRLSRAAGPSYVFIDELHLAGDWHGLLRWLHERFPNTRVAATSSASGVVYAHLFQEPLDWCRVVVLSERDASNRKSVSDGFGVQGGLKYNIKGGEVEIKGLTKAAKQVTRIEVPAEVDGHPVTVIASGAFHDRVSLEEVLLPPSVLSIGDYAFSGCVRLTQIALPEALTRLGDNAFRGCVALQDIVGGDRLRHIGSGALLGTAWLRGHRPGLITVGAVLYSYTGEEEALVVPEWVEAIADYAFAEHERVTSIRVDNPDCVLGEGLAYHCSALASFSHAAGRFEIPAHSFSYCRELRMVGGVAIGEVGSFAFLHCSKLETLELDGSVRFGHCAFLGCDSLRRLDGHCEAVSVSNGAFAGTTRLEVTPSFLTRVEAVGHFAFRGSNLRHLTLLRPKLIGGWAFADCGDLAAVDIQGAPNVGPGILEGCDAVSAMTVDGSHRLSYLFGGRQCVPESLRRITVTGESIATNFARGCVSLEQLTVTGHVRRWGGWAFYGCTNLASLELAEGLSVVGDWAFCRCSELGSVTLPRSIRTVGMNAFRYCSSLGAVTLLADERPVALKVNAFYATHDNRVFYVPAAMMSGYADEAAWRDHLSEMRAFSDEY